MEFYPHLYTFFGLLFSVWFSGFCYDAAALNTKKERNKQTKKKKENEVEMMGRCNTMKLWPYFFIFLRLASSISSH